MRLGWDAKNSSMVVVEKASRVLAISHQCV